MIRSYSILIIAFLLWTGGVWAALPAIKHTVRGQVSTEDGQHLAKVRLDFEAIQLDSGYVRPHYQFSDRRGMYSTIVRRAGVWVVKADVPGCFPFRDTLMVIGDGHTMLNITIHRLDQAAFSKGDSLGPDDGRIIGQIVHGKTTFPLRDVQLTLSPANSPIVLHATTDVQGHFAFRGLFGGWYSVGVRHKDFKDYQISRIRLGEGQTYERMIYFHPRELTTPDTSYPIVGRIEGEVVDGLYGAALPAEVHVAAPWMDATQWGYSPRPTSHFVFEGVPAGSRALYVKTNPQDNGQIKHSGTVLRSPIIVRDGRTTMVNVTVPLPLTRRLPYQPDPPGVITGHLSNPWTDEPMENVWVEVIGIPHRWKVVDDRFSIPLLPPGVYSIAIAQRRLPWILDEPASTVVHAIHVFSSDTTEVTLTLPEYRP